MGLGNGMKEKNDKYFFKYTNGKVENKLQV